MKELFVVPVALATILGMVAELELLATDAQERTLQYAEDTLNALDCAYEARPITECSPGITNPDFEEQIKQTNKLLKETKKLQQRPSQTTQVAGQ